MRICDDTDCKLESNDCNGDKEVFDKENCRCACKKPFTGKNCDIIICNKSEKGCKANELFNLSAENLQKENIVNHLKDYSLESSRENIETELLQNHDTTVNISQTPMKFGGYEQGKVLIIRNITDRKNAAEELKESERKYRTLVENTSDIIYYLDIMGNFTYINPAFERISGYKVEEIIGKDYNSLVREDYLPQVQEEFYQI